MAGGDGTYGTSIPLWKASKDGGCRLMNGCTVGNDAADHKIHCTRVG